MKKRKNHHRLITTFNAALLLLGVGCGLDPNNHSTIEDSSELGTIASDVVIDTEGPNQMGLRVNNLRALTEVVIPHVARRAGLDEILIADKVLNEGTGRALGCRYRAWTQLEGFYMDAGIDRRAVTASTDLGEQLVVNIDLDDASPEILITLHAVGEPGKGFDYCPDFHLYFYAYADGVEAEFESTLGIEDGARVQMEDIHKAEIQLTELGIYSKGVTSFVDTILTFMSWFGLSCDDLDECVSTMANNAIREDGTIRDALKDLINSGLAHDLSFDEKVKQDDFDLEYGLALAEVNVEIINRLYTQWPTHLSSKKTTDLCEPHLNYIGPRSINPDYHPPVSALDLVVPYGIFADAIIVAAEQGVLCTTVPMPLDDYPLGDGLVLLADVVPYGRIDIVAGREPDEANLYIPFTIQNARVIQSATGTIVHEPTGAFNGMLGITMRAHMDRPNQILEVRFSPPRLESLDGAVTFPGMAITGSDLYPFLVDELPAIRLEPWKLPRVIDISGDPASTGNLYLELSEALFQNPALRVGFQVCESISRSPGSYCVGRRPPGDSISP